MRPIDADALLNELPLHPDGGLRSFKNLGIMTRVRKTIMNAPTIDAVPVVRCKDCKYFIQTVFFGNKMNACRRHGSSTILPTARIVADDWFCADGERWKE